ncbi:hypothetical protein EMIT0111MI5_110115 [Burkholderia sp. IT-111MI5]
MANILASRSSLASMLSAKRRHKRLSRLISRHRQSFCFGRRVLLPIDFRSQRRFYRSAHFSVGISMAYRLGRGPGECQAA